MLFGVNFSGVSLILCFLLRRGEYILASTLLLDWLKSMFNSHHYCSPLSLHIFAKLIKYEKIINSNKILIFLSSEFKNYKQDNDN